MEGRQGGAVLELVLDRALMTVLIPGRSHAFPMARAGDPGERPYFAAKRGRTLASSEPPARSWIKSICKVVATDNRHRKLLIKTASKGMQLSAT